MSEENCEELKKLQTITRELLKKKPFADVALVIDKNQRTLVHLPVLSIRWKSLLPEKKVKEVVAARKKKGKTISYDLPKNKIPNQAVLDLLLNFVYTGEIDFAKLGPDAVFDLLVAADEFKDLEPLQNMCKRHIFHMIDISNIYTMMKRSHEGKKAAIREYCLHWAASHYEDFVKNREGVRLLGIELFQQVSIDITTLKAQRDSGASAAVQPPAEQPNTLLRDFKLLHDQMFNADCVARIGGQQVRFHRAILGIHSEMIHKFLGGEGGPNPRTQGDKYATLKYANDSNLDVEALSADAFRALLRFYYYGNTDFDTKAACQLIPLCHDYSLVELRKVAEAKARNDFDTGTVLSVLNLTYVAFGMSEKDEQNAGLRSRTIAYILDNFKSVDLTPLGKMEQGKNISIDLLLAYQGRASGKE